MKKLSKEIGSYAIFGILTTIISVLTYKLFLYLNMNYIVSSGLSSGLAILFAYVTNRLYVFESKNNIISESIKFFIVRISVLVIETVLLVIIVSYFHFDAFYSKIAVIILVIIANYILSKFIVFRESKKEGLL